MQAIYLTVRLNILGISLTVVDKYLNNYAKLYYASCSTNFTIAADIP